MCLCSLVLAAGLPGPITAETVSFQNGVGGYESGVDIRINDDVLTLHNKGSAVQYYWIDGDQSNGTEINYWGLIRFDGIFGTEAGMIPPGATIVSATLELTTPPTSVSADVISGGPFGVARLLRPFDETQSTTGWGTVFGTDGPDLTDIDRPAGGYRNLLAETTHGTNITPIVQAWSSGAPNYGVVLIAATSNAWMIHTTGAVEPTVRPKLIVEYTRTPSRAVLFQEGVEGYTGTSMIFLRMDGITAPGEEYVTEYLDKRGAEPDTTNTVHALVKFDELFGNGTGKVPPLAQILKAYLVVTTAPRSESYQTRTGGPFNVRQLLVDFNWTLADGAPGLRFWSDFGENGPTEEGGTIGPVIASAESLIWDSQAWFEITDTVKGWQAGEVDKGLIIESASDDGWKIHWLKEGAVPPQLVVLVPSRVPDLNGDTYVDQADVTLFVNCASGPAIPYRGECAMADLDSDQDVDQVDFGILQACYSGTEVAEPGCL